MHRQPLADQLPYHFYPPKLNPFWLWMGRYFIRHLVRSGRKVTSIDITGTEHLAGLRGRGESVLITPNHPDIADCGVMFELADRLRWPFYFMAAYQLFTGIGRVGLPRIGVFPVDREGTDLRAFKTAVEILATASNPLVVFPEGEVYFQADRLTPLREGAAVLAATAYKRIASSQKTVWIVPAAVKYRFLEKEDPVPAFHALVDKLETRFTWRPRRDLHLADRIYRFAEGILGLKELEYLGTTRPGSLPDRLAHLRTQILERLESKRLGKLQTVDVPVRVKELRHVCLELLADPKTTPEVARELRIDLEDLFGVMQLYSYPGNYIRESPTLERVAEILMKLEQDVLGVDAPVPHARRSAILQLGEPLDVRQFAAAAGGKLRATGVALTTAIEERIQGLLDAAGPGRPITASLAPAAPQQASPPPAELQRSSA